MIFIYKYYILINIIFKLTMEQLLLIKEYKKSRLIGNENYNNIQKKWSIKPNEWFIEIDNKNKKLLPYQKEMLKELYSIFYLAKNSPSFHGFNQSGAIYFNYYVQPKITSYNQLCTIFYCCKQGYEGFYHVNLFTNKIRKITQIDKPIRESNRKKQKTQRYSPY